MILRENFWIYNIINQSSNLPINKQENRKLYEGMIKSTYTRL